jgi:hypothetical protein
MLRPTEQPLQTQVCRLHSPGPNAAEALLQLLPTKHDAKRENKHQGHMQGRIPTLHLSLEAISK